MFFLIIFFIKILKGWFSGTQCSSFLNSLYIFVAFEKHFFLFLVSAAYTPDLFNEEMCVLEMVWLFWLMAFFEFFL